MLSLKNEYEPFSELCLRNVGNKENNPRGKVLDIRKKGDQRNEETFLCKSKWTLYKIIMIMYNYGI